MEPKHIQIKDYNYPLPDERIAKFPLERRDASKLLVYRQGTIATDIFSQLPEHLPQGALMVFNNTRVVRARLHFRKGQTILCPTSDNTTTDLRQYDEFPWPLKRNNHRGVAHHDG